MWRREDRSQTGAGEGNILEKHRIKRTLQSGSGRSRIYVHFMQIRHDLQISAWTSMWCRAPRRDPRVYPKALKWFSSLYQSYWSRKISPLTLLPLTVNDVHVYVYVLWIVGGNSGNFVFPPFQIAVSTPWICNSCILSSECTNSVQFFAKLSAEAHGLGTSVSPSVGLGLFHQFCHIRRCRWAGHHPHLCGSSGFNEIRLRYRGGERKGAVKAGKGYHSLSSPSFLYFPEVHISTRHVKFYGGGLSLQSYQVHLYLIFWLPRDQGTIVTISNKLTNKYSHKAIRLQYWNWFWELGK